MVNSYAISLRLNKNNIFLNKIFDLRDENYH